MNTASGGSVGWRAITNGTSGSAVTATTTPTTLSLVRQNLEMIVFGHRSRRAVTDPQKNTWRPPVAARQPHRWRLPYALLPAFNVECDPLNLSHIVTTARRYRNRASLHRVSHAAVFLHPRKPFGGRES